MEWSEAERERDLDPGRREGVGCIGVLPTFPVRGETGNDAEIFR